MAKYTEAIKTGPMSISEFCEELDVDPAIREEVERAFRTPFHEVMNRRVRFKFNVDKIDYAALRRYQSDPRFLILAKDIWEAEPAWLQTQRRMLREETARILQHISQHAHEVRRELGLLPTAKCYATGEDGQEVFIGTVVDFDVRDIIGGKNEI